MNDNTIEWKKEERKTDPSNTHGIGNTSVKQTEKGEKKIGALMIPLFDIPFAPAYDDLYPVKDEKDKGFYVSISTHIKEVKRSVCSAI